MALSVKVIRELAGWGCINYMGLGQRRTCLKHTVVIKSAYSLKPESVCVERGGEYGQKVEN